MKKLPLSILFFSWMFNSIYGQSVSPQVIASTGTVFTQGGFSIQYTAGEVAVSSLTSPTHMVTQGFHQVYSTINTSGLVENTDIEISAYPNPTYDKITIRRNGLPEHSLLVSISDIYGKALQVLTWESEFLYTDLSALAAGTYIIDVLNKENNQLITHFKIQKLSNQ